MKRLSIIVVVTLLLSACISDIASKPNSFSDYGEPADCEWLYWRPFVFSPDSIADSSVTGTLLISIRHTAAYPYSNIWVELSNGMPDDSATYRCDTFDIELADAFGHWYGKGMGVSLRRTDTVATNYTIHRGQPLTLRHIMRTDTLPQVEQVGLIFLPN